MLVAVCDDVYVDRCALQIRLDFDTFIITGPSTKTVTGTWITFPVESDDQVQYSNCGTDTFGVTNAPTLPVVCGTLTGEHGTIAIFQLFRVALKSHFVKITAYFEASDLCHTLSFGFGQTAVGSAIPTTRKFSIKVRNNFTNIETISDNNISLGNTNQMYRP